ncbi:MAG TPA: metallophosphoesterase family protein [Acidimicrobiales bacterium]|jgi:hypothetical protein|nr:metallophosphoesterase family protein [Acidimicrobiales bacterium]
MLIGLIADTHDAIGPWSGVLPKVAETFAGVGLILHCGDLTTSRVLDDLATIADVVAVRSDNDPAADPPRLLEGPQVVEIGGVVIGLVNWLGESEPADVFGRRVDVVVHGGSHRAEITHAGGTVLVNPGSPTLADEVTVALLDTAWRPPKVEIVTL